MIYFTTDLHIGHNAIIYMAHRPFSSVGEMNEILINNTNDLVNNNDTLYILGDLCYKLTSEQANEYIRRINGEKILIRGNHDKQYDESLFEGIYDYLEIFQHNHCFVMMHYPLRSWNKMRKGSIQLHGHIHATSQYNEDNRNKGIYQYDVGVDANDYHPISTNQILEYFKDVPLIDFAHL